MAEKDLFAWSVKVGERGQIVLPKEARDVFDIRPGETIMILGDRNRGLAIPTKEDLNKMIKAGMFTNVK